MTVQRRAGCLAAGPWLRPAPAWLARAAAATLLCTYGYVFLLDAQRYNNHYYLSILLATWFSLAPPAVASSPGGVRTVPGWVVAAVKAQLAAVYFFGGVSRRRDCHFADALSPSLLKQLLNVEGDAAE